ncbi:MAG: flagellar motor protein MotB [Lachnospiraceae bacterium]|nr:flagellar motor protein MotB [Lachnospiraceae bacterium]
MAKRKEQPAEEGSPAWMATFSDLMNLLLCFFVLLFASSTTDAEKIMRIVNSFNPESYSILEAGSVSLAEGQIISGGVTQLPGIESLLEYIGVATEAKGNNNEAAATGTDNGEDKKDTTSEEAEDITNPFSYVKEDEASASSEQAEAAEISEKELKEQMEEQGLEQSEEMYDEITEIAESYDIDDRIVMDYNSQYVSLDLNGAILFDAGQADIRSDARVFMQRIAAILGKYKDCVIEIEGHTDNIPIHSDKYESNRYLSTARANKVLEFVEANADLIDENMKAAGYGESRPVASNATEEGRAKNRRVSIKIYNQLNSAVQ